MADGQSPTFTIEDDEQKKPAAAPKFEIAEAETQPKPALQRFQESFRGAMGFNPEGSATSDIKDIGAGFKEMAGHPIESAKLLTHGIIDPMQATAQAGLERMRKPGLGNKIAGGAEYLEGGVPLIGPWLAGAGHQFESGDIAGGVGTMAPAIVAPLAERGAGLAAE